jgi:pimeloyl-ACP methyl ester carboxylesterase
MSEHTLHVPGANLHYELRGSGPLLAVVGAPMAGAYLAPLAAKMAADHTVLTYDPRGIARSTLDGPPGEDTPELRADDVRPLIEAAGGGPTDVFGSSGGAVTGLALVVARPELVRTLVAHEPPVTPLLPDAADLRAWNEDLVQTYREHGPDAAMGKFMADLGVEPMAGFDELPEPVLAQIRRDNEYFFGHQILGTSACTSRTSRLCSPRRRAWWSASAPPAPGRSPTAPPSHSPNGWAHRPSSSPATTPDFSPSRRRSRWPWPAS